MRISDWSSDVCSSDLKRLPGHLRRSRRNGGRGFRIGNLTHGSSYSFLATWSRPAAEGRSVERSRPEMVPIWATASAIFLPHPDAGPARNELVLVACSKVWVRDLPEGPENLFQAADLWGRRSEEHTSELQSLMRISYAVFC